jgi:O-antigen/teichoic acid export membrane protein
MKPSGRDTVWVACGAIVAAAGGFAFTWVVARTLGPASTGVVLTVTSWFTVLITVGKLAMDTTLVREGSRIRVEQPGAGAPDLLRWTLRPALVVTGLMSLLVLALIEPISGVLVEGSTENLQPMIAASAVCLPFGVYTIIKLGLMRGLGAIRAPIGIEQIVKPSVRVVGAAVAAVAVVTTPAPFVYVWLIPVPLAALLVARVSRAASRAGQPDPAPRSERRRVWAFARPRALSQIVDILNTSIGILLLGATAGAAAAGEFGTSLRILMAGMLAFQAMRILVAPSLGSFLASARLEKAQEVFSSAAALIVLCTWPLYLVCLVYPSAVLGVFGEGFRSSTLTLQLLALSGMILALIGNQGSVVLMSGASRAALYAVTASFVANVVVTTALVSRMGSAAAAAGWLTGTIVEGLVLAGVVRRLGMQPWPAPARRAGLLTVTSLGVGILASRALAGSSTTAAVVVLLMALVAWVLIALPFARQQFSALTRD